MLIRNVGRWLCMLGIAWTGACAVASCGSGNTPSQFNGGNQDSGGGDDATTNPNMDGGGLFHDGGTSNGCKPATKCGKNKAGQVENCGFEGDGCGGKLD